MTRPVPGRAAVWLVSLLAAGGLAACRAGVIPSTATGHGNIITLAAGTQCGHDAITPAAIWLDTAAALGEAYRGMTRQSIGAPDLPSPPPDFAEFGVLQVFMGRQPAGGYQLRLLHPRVEYLRAGATIRVEWLSPPSDTLTAQVITSPCLLLAVPRGDYRSLTVTDQAGRTRAVAGL